MQLYCCAGISAIFAVLLTLKVSDSPCTKKLDTSSATHKLGASWLAKVLDASFPSDQLFAKGLASLIGA